MAAPRDLVETVKAKLKKKYKMSDDGEAKRHLGLDIRWSLDRRSVELYQPEYARSILEAARMTDCNPWPTPTTTTPLIKAVDPITEEESEKMTGLPYKKIVGMLGYLADTTRPELSFAVSQVRRYSDDARPYHWRAVLHILHYVKGTLDHGIRYTRDPDVGGGQPLVNIIEGWADSDFAEDRATRKSTSGYVFLLNGAAISWKVRKQGCVTRSTAEAELVALDLATREGLWLRKLSKGLEIPGMQTLKIYEDNESCLNIANGSKWSDLTKHIDIKYFAVRDDVIYKRIKVASVASANNTADLFTKPLGRIKFERFRQQMGVVHCGALHT